MNAITFQTEEGREAVFYIVAQGTLNGKSYLLVTESEGGDADAMILRDDTASSSRDAETALFTLVTGETELADCAALFREMLGDEDEIIIQED